MPPVNLAELQSALHHARAAAVARFRVDHRPAALLAALRRAADQSLRALVRAYPLPRGAALAAVGGYGRGELYPGSDVDLLILLPGDETAHKTEHETADNPASAAIAKLLAALWDVGLQPGHSVRSVAGCLRAAAADITVETALLESRWLAGSRALLRRLQDALRGQLDARRFFAAKRAELRARHARYGDTPYALEPHCKESPGGLRDIQVIAWLTRAAQLGSLLTPDEARALARAERAFARLRIELHLLAGRREDRLLFELQPALARAYGFTDTPQQRASERLMQRYYWAARRVTQLNLILLQTLQERLFADADRDSDRDTAIDSAPLDADFCVQHGRLALIDADACARNPALLLRAFVAMQQAMQQNPALTGMAASLLRAIWHQRLRIDAAYRRDPAHRQLFLRVLQAPQGVVRALRLMATLNVLPRYLPSYRRAVGQIQHNLFHAWTVDEHSLAVIAHLRRFSQPRYAQAYPLACRLMARFERPWRLTIAALFHDIAKGQTGDQGDHSELGARAVRRFARQHRLDAADTALIEFLVRQHLLMSQVAQKRDLSDPAVIALFARTVATPERLDALYLLTEADIRATHPTLWNGWKAKLLADLHDLTHAALAGEAADTASVLARRKRHAARLARQAGVADAARARLWRRFDDGYFLRHTALELAWHCESLCAAHLPAPLLPAPLLPAPLLPAPLLSTPPTTPTVVRARVLPDQHALQLLVATRDRADLFETLCGYFAAHALDVQDARIHTSHRGRDDALALDTFVVLPRYVTPDYDPNADPGAALAAQTERALADWLARPAARVGQTPRALPSRQSRQFPITPQIALHPDGAHWQLALTATDRPGLLHALAQVLRRHGVNLDTAKIMTLGARVEDVFRVSGAALTDPQRRAQLAADLLAALAVPDPRSKDSTPSATLPA